MHSEFSLNKEIIIFVSKNEWACSSCSIQITTPSGKNINVILDQNGRHILKLSETGRCLISLVISGKEAASSSFEVNADSTEVSKNRGTKNIPSIIGILLAFLAVVVRVYYVVTKKR